MDLERYRALKMMIRKIDDSDYLFIEAGGFSSRQKPDWKAPWLVLKRN